MFSINPDLLFYSKYIFTSCIASSRLHIVSWSNKLWIYLFTQHFIFLLEFIVFWYFNDVINLVTLLPYLQNEFIKERKVYFLIITTEYIHCSRNFYKNALKPLTNIFPMSVWEISLQHKLIFHFFLKNISRTLFNKDMVKIENLGLIKYVNIFKKLKESFVIQTLKILVEFQSLHLAKNKNKHFSKKLFPKNQIGNIDTSFFRSTFFSIQICLSCHYINRTKKILIEKVNIIHSV